MEEHYYTIGAFVIGNLGAIIGVLKWYHAKEIKLAERLTRIEGDINGIALVLGTKRALSENGKVLSTKEDQAQT